MRFANLTEKVAVNCDWDHKPYILKTFNFKHLKEPQKRHQLGDFNYYHDIWSNIHYGYVGTAAGFIESELLEGAGIEQIGLFSKNCCYKARIRCYLLRDTGRHP